MASLKVTYPEGGLQLRLGSYYEIKWENIKGIATNVNIELWESTSPAKISDLALNVSNDGSFFWQVSRLLTERSDYYIRVETTDTVTADNGTDFEIIAAHDLTEFNNLESFEKVILIEMRLGLEISLAGWALNSGGSPGVNSYEISYTGPELVSIEESGTALTRVFSESDCDNLENSFFHDIYNQILYAHLTGDLDPTSSGIFLIGFTWVCFANRQDTDFIIDFTPQDATLPVFYLPYLNVSSVPMITQKLAEYFTQALTNQFGSLNFNNDGWFWENKNVYLWHNKECYVKLGEKDTPYDEFVTIFPGHTRKPTFNDDRVTISLKDQRAGILKSIPVNKYNTTDFPNLNTDEENEVRPVLFGIKTGIIPKEVNTANYTYEISQTVFNGTTYAVDAVDAVYVEGVRIYVTDNYTVDLNAGTITLLDNPRDGEITVDAQGIECQYDFATGLPTGVFSENVADILFFILTELNNIPIDKIDLSTFDDLQTARTQRLGWYLNEEQPTDDFIRLLQTSATFHFMPTLDGRFMVRYYDRAISADSLVYQNYSYKNFKILEDTDSTFQFVVLRYDKEPSTDNWLIINDNEVETSYKHNEKTTLTIDTALVNSAEAEALALFFINLIKDPPDKVSAEVEVESMRSIPSDKAYFNRSIKNMEGEEVTILENEIYLILEVKKNIQTARVNIMAIKDTQASGTGGHTDIPHQDTHQDESYDDHTDSVHIDHTDNTHADTHTDSHVDNYHSDHNDSVHCDHSDGVHSDYTDSHSNHNDGSYDDHTDYADVHVDHQDNRPHADHQDDLFYNDHDDEVHFDTHGDCTQNHDDSSYTDSHSDVAHVDETHLDHGDGYDDDYTDTHEDEHANIPHTDSET